MKMKFLDIAAVAALLAALFSCGKPEEKETFDVQLVVPESIVLEDDAKTLSFDILSGKVKPTDVVILSGLDGQTVCSVYDYSTTELTVSLTALPKDGNYSVSIQRGAEVLKQGTVTISVSHFHDGITPAYGATVYGKVSCSGVGIAGVSVSDGYEVVQTDADGVYQMSSAKRHKYVFISLPSGYAAPLNGILPSIHQQLELRASAPERKDFELVRVEGQDNYSMLVFGDIHLANRTDDRAQFAKVTADVNSYISSHAGEKFYGLTLGDMTWDQYWIEKQYCFKEYVADANAMRGLPVFHTIGNHDHSIYYAGDFDTVVEYKANIAPTYYSFNIGQVHYVVLDDIECQNNGDGTTAGRDYASNIVSEQLEWLRKDLAFVPKDKPLVLTMHSAVYHNPGSARGGSSSNIKASAASALEDAVRGYPEIHIFSAHSHKMYNVDNMSSDKTYEHNAGAVCATWWWSGHCTPGVHVCQDGTPGGYTVLKVAGKDISWQYKAAGYPIDYQFRTYDRNQIAITAENWTPKANDAHIEVLNEYNTQWRSVSTDNYVFMNIWNYDPSWKVEVKEVETGKTLPVTRQGLTRDPLHLISYMVPRINGNDGTTFETVNTYHMFRVTASSPSTTLEIKVTDRFGNVSTETMTRPKAFTIANYRSEALLY